MYTVTKSLFDSNGRKYININNEKEEIRLKIPFRYNRVMCTVTGDKTIQELLPGDQVSIKMKNCGKWEIGETREYSGICYKCEEISFVSS